MINTKEKLQNEWDKISPTQIIKLEEIKETRSWAQNRLYHKWITDLCNVFDDRWIFITHDDLHDWLRDKLIKWTYKTCKITWKRRVERKSSSKLKRKEFSQYLKDIENYLRQTYEISHPLPTDLEYNEYKKWKI